MSYYLGFTPTPEFWALLTLVATGAGSALTFALTKYFELKTKAQEREQNRLDKEQEAKEEAAREERRLKAIAAVATEGGKREKRILDKVDKVQRAAETSIKVSKEAIKTSNGIKEDVAAKLETVIARTTPTDA